MHPRARLRGKTASGRTALTKPVRFRFSRLSVADREAAREPLASRRSEMIVARHHVFEMRISLPGDRGLGILPEIARFGDIFNIPRNKSSVTNTCITIFGKREKNDQMNQYQS